MKKLAVFLTLLSFSKITFVSELSSGQSVQNQKVVHSDQLLRLCGYSEEQIKNWKKLEIISKKEENRIPLTLSERCLVLEEELITEPVN